MQRLAGLLTGVADKDGKSRFLRPVYLKSGSKRKKFPQKRK
jgi:hypothetical protein